MYDDRDMYLDPQEPTSQASQLTPLQTERIFTASEPEGGSQTFYPSFLYNTQPLGHSRPIFYQQNQQQQEAAYSQRPNGGYRQQQLYDNNLKFTNPFRRENNNYQVAQETSQSLLGSGNFGVIRGGTFYNENDSENSDYSGSGRYNNYSPFFHNNGHGRPSFYFGATNPRPTQHEQFANFRDFADINTPNPAYSQYVVVYINKNGSKIEEPHKIQKKTIVPKNIIERLAMIDLELIKKSTDEDAEKIPQKKLSVSKRKLAQLPPEKKYKIKKATTTSTTPLPDLYEPLLALS